jgi:hypothetical protein
MNQMSANSIEIEIGYRGYALFTIAERWGAKFNWNRQDIA